MDQNPQHDIVYDPLDSGSNQFRLLTLLKKDHNGDLPSCELFHSSLEERKEYEALSYTWGDAKKCGKIRLNGEIRLVTQNLARALADIRSADSSRVLWVDAICINQGNIHERNHQVKHMGRIYQKALRVLVWLGRPEDTVGARSSDGLSALRFFDKVIRKGNHDLEDRISVQKLSQLVQNSKHWDKWHEVAVLCELPYWNRLWIVQEIGLATDLEVYHGYFSIDWRIFAHIRQLLVQIVQRQLYGERVLPLVQIILNSMPARLEEQRSHQHPFWINNLRKNLSLLTNPRNPAIRSAYILSILLDTASQLSPKERDSLHIEIKKGSKVIHNIGKNFILHSEESISGLLSKTQLRTLEATHDSMLGNRAVSWLFGSNVADAIATLPSRLEHVKDHQQKEFDEKFLQNIANLRSIFGRYLRETSPLDWESHEFLLGNVSMPQLSCNNRYKVFSDTGLTPGAHNLRKVRAVHRIVLEPISKSGRGKRSVLPRSGKLQKLLAMKAEVVYFQGHLASLVRELKSISSSLRMHRERQQPAFRLHTLLENCERSLCQEPRDKVYGLLGLASNVDDGEVAVDYSKPLLELYMDTIAHYGAFQKAESPATNGTDLVRFGQLLQRSLSGPFPYPPKNKALETIVPSLAKPAIKVAGYISGPILPLEPIRNIETPTDTTNQERMAILKNYFRGSVDMFVLSDDISKTLSQLRVVERDRVIPNSTSGNSTPSQLKNHLRLFSEASGLIGIAASNIREDDLLCLFAKCDIACVVRPVENHYKIISRAVVAKRFGEKEQKVSSYSPELFQHHVPDPSELEENNRVLFEIDALTLQELTCPTSSMRREYNFNTVEKSKLEADR